MLVESLRSGRTKSCGHPPCKYEVNSYDHEFQPRRPRVMTLRQVKAAWHAYHRVARRRTLQQLADHYEVNRHALDGIFRSVRKSGGIDRYLTLLKDR